MNLGLGNDRTMKYYETFIAPVSIVNELFQVQSLFLYYMHCNLFSMYVTNHNTYKWFC